jgi:DNA-binding transcriptional LysR family regulator
MKLEFFTTLESVLRHGSLAGAADEVNLSPSAVSMQMKQLETYFGKPLFSRGALRVKPTPFAIEVCAAMRQTLETLDGLRQRPSPAVSGKVRLGVIETMQAVMLPGAMRYLRDRHPQLTVRPVRGRSAELVEAVKSGAIDAAVLAQPETGGSSRLDWCPLLREEFVLIAPPDSRETGVAELFRAHEWVRFDKATIGGRIAARYVHTHVGETRSTFELQSTHAVVAMVSAGLGVSIILLPDPRITMGYPVRVIKLGAHAPSMRISMVSHKSTAAESTIRALVEAFRSVPNPSRIEA